MNLTDICIKKPVFAWMLMAATVVFGGIAATRIGISQFPDVDFPTISVSVTWEGAAPEVVEHDVIELLEEAVVQVEGVRSITSSSRQGGGILRWSSTSPGMSIWRCRMSSQKSLRPSGVCRKTRTPRSSQKPTPKTNRSCGSVSPALFRRGS